MSLNKRLISGEAPTPGPAGFRALGFTGNGGAQTVTGMGFQPDIVWIKDRDTAYQHNIYFSSGGTGAAGWALEPSGTSAKYALSGLNFSIFFVKILLRSKPANNLSILFFPPCFPTKIGVVTPNLIISLT